MHLINSFDCILFNAVEQNLVIMTENLHKK